VTDLQHLGEARLLEDVRAEVKPTAQSMVWRFSKSGDEMCLKIEWASGGEKRFDTYLSSNLDAVRRTDALGWFGHCGYHVTPHLL
jgi:hypothetical protein